MRYYDVLKKHGYEATFISRKVCVFEKLSLHKAVCVVEKNNHNKGVKFIFSINRANNKDDQISNLHYSFMLKEIDNLKKLFTVK